MAAAANKTLDTAVQRFESQSTLHALLSLIQTYQNEENIPSLDTFVQDDHIKTHYKRSKLRSCVEATGLLLNSINEELSQSRIVNAILECLEAKDPSVRMASTFCLVDFAKRKGEAAFWDFMEDRMLSPKYKKLIEVYIEKRRRNGQF